MLLAAQEQALRAVFRGGCVGAAGLAALGLSLAPRSGPGHRAVMKMKRACCAAGLVTVQHVNMPPPKVVVQLVSDASMPHLLRSH